MKGLAALRARAARVPANVWGPLVAGFLVGLAGAIGLLAGKPWLFPSLGPTAYLQSERPDLPSSRLYNVLVGHLVGLGAGFLAVAVLGAWDAPVVLTTHRLSPARVGAAALAIALTLLASALIRSSHPPAAATTLLVALGAFRTASDALTVAAGVLIVGVVGEGFRRLRREG